MAVKAPYQVLTSLMSGPRTSSISATFRALQNPAVSRYTNVPAM
jgi:hypothetical protein